MFVSYLPLGSCTKFVSRNALSPSSLMCFDICTSTLSRALDIETFEGNSIFFKTFNSFGIAFKFGLVDTGDISPTISRSTYSGYKSNHLYVWSCETGFKLRIWGSNTSWHGLPSNVPIKQPFSFAGTWGRPWHLLLSERMCVLECGGCRRGFLHPLRLSFVSEMFSGGTLCRDCSSCLQSNIMDRHATQHCKAQCYWQCMRWSLLC